MSNTTSNYNIKPLKVNAYSNYSSEFALQINFERNSEGITGILLQYHLICAILVILASINFLFDAKDTNRSCLLAALLLVMTTIFSVGQVFMYFGNCNLNKHITQFIIVYCRMMHLVSML